MNEHKIIDLLPNREAVTVEKWLKTRPHIKIVTRDCYSRYAKGVSNGLPDAVQAADRWHLLKNMGDALKKLLERKRQEIKRNSKLSEPVIAINDPDEIMKRITTDQSRRQEQMNQVKKLHNAGMGIKKIEAALKMSRVTIRKCLRLDAPPPKNAAKTNIALFNAYIQQRMEEDQNVQILQLWKEIMVKGFNGGKSAVYEYLKQYVDPQNSITMPNLKLIAWLLSKVSLLLCIKEEMLSSREKKLIQELQRISPDIKVAWGLITNASTSLP